ncbi:Retrovirus-related Pol polyprotein from type-2 retrotransposable element R2DM [Sesamum angolense]|uniref:Retrovirus-related Pol polyprotein from type-2 retrotransposable element R2DM n=1 Tax=Sesamum angolense TaxID=2727404 RepID=A0AAE1VWS5_9LAMI|nr:Retrovirus-related Pol polyprotein from type-2 retrotransposable element R2DM [Sesamum angolense]
MAGLIELAVTVWHMPWLVEVTLMRCLDMSEVMLRQRSEASMAERWRDQCSKVFFRQVATRRGLLGGNRTEEAIDLQYLHPWARHTLRTKRLGLLFVLLPLMSPSQNAFVPGRLISDNVLLAQELFSSYNQCRLPPRCALKVDLRKAFDTVEWDFFIATLRMFGFPAVFIRWIEECVTSAHYSVVVNGGVHGYFAGARGLRQGDPMSPYLFVLVMEVLHMILQQLIEQDGEFRYHWRCQELNLFQLSFADDLILFKIDSRIKGWEGIQLFFAGRVPLIKSVLVSFEVYWALAFILPKGIIKEMIKRLCTFLWKGTSSSGYPKVAWETVCRPIEEGGLGIKDILALNRALMIKENKGAWGWRKMLSLRHTLMSQIHYRVGNGNSVSLWHDPWHPLGPLIPRFPRGPQLTRIGLLDKLSVVIKDGQWNWPLITDIACLEITHMIPPISEGPDRISWNSKDGTFNTSTAYELFHPPGPKIPLPWPYRDWQHGVQWASSRWRGKHVVNAAYRSLLASLVYHIWQERNSRRFQQHSRPPSIWAVLLWRRSDRGSLVPLYDILSVHLVFTDYGKSLGLARDDPSDLLYYLNFSFYINATYLHRKKKKKPTPKGRSGAFQVEGLEIGIEDPVETYTKYCSRVSSAGDSRAYKDYILDMASGGCVVRHGHHKPYPVQSENVARMVDSKRGSVPCHYMTESSPMHLEMV